MALFLLFSMTDIRAAYSYDLSNLTKFPDGAAIDDATFAERTEIFRYEPSDRLDFAFELRVPKSYVQTSSQSNGDFEGISQNFMQEIVRFTGEPIGSLRPVMRVSVQRLSRDIYAEDWLASYIRSGSFQGRAYMPLERNDAMAIYTGIDRSVSTRDLNVAYAYMARAIISGDIVFLFTVGYPVNHFASYADLQARLAHSFNLLNPQPPQIETLRRFAMLDVLNFSYPASWTIRNPNFQDNDHYSVELLRTQAGRLVVGRIRIDIYRNSAFAVEGYRPVIEHFKRQLATRGYQLKEQVGSVNAPESTRFTESIVSIYDLEVKDRFMQEEFWLYFLYGNEYSFFVSMVTPTQVTGYDNWIHNRAVMLNLISSFE